LAKINTRYLSKSKEKRMLLGSTSTVKSAVKSMMVTGAAVAGAAVAMVVGMGAIDALTNRAQAFGLVHIDFDTLTEGTTLSHQFEAQGVTFGSTPTIFRNVRGRYPGATGMNFVPGDVRRQLFTDVVIKFSAPINYFSIMSLDSDEPVTLKGFYQGQLVASKFYAHGSDWHVNTLEMGDVNGAQLFDEVVLDLVDGRTGSVEGGPEFYDNLKFNVVGHAAACR
jgi:hypothetical protein